MPIKPSSNIPDYQWMPQDKQDKQNEFVKNNPDMPDFVTGGPANLPTSNPVTTLSPVRPDQLLPDGYGSMLGKDIEAAYWDAFNKGGGGGGGKPQDLSVSLAGRSPDFMGFQDQTTQYMKNLMGNAGDMAEGMFGQGAYNQMTGDNDVTVQRELQKLEEQFGGDVNHPAYQKAKNDLVSASRMYNARALTDLTQKAGQYGIAVGEMVKNYYDVYSSREEEQQKLQLAVDEFNVETKLKQKQMAISARNAAAGQKMAALASIAANRKWEMEFGLKAATTELQARSADKISQMNFNMEMYQIDVAESTAKKQRNNNILTSLINLGGNIIGGLI